MSLSREDNLTDPFILQKQQGVQVSALPTILQS